MIYENLLGGDGGEETLLDLIEFQPEEDDQAFIERIVEGVKNCAAELDGEIASYLSGWTIERIAKVDLSILRLAVWELKNEKEIDPSIICDEAVALAQRYSTENSGRFVNGVLGAYIRKQNAEA